jgi:hypothetical protein
MKTLEDLKGRNIVVYDCEIKREIGSRVEGKEITWDTHELMGISVACLYDYQTGDFSVHLDDNLQDLAARLNRADLVVAFNHINFDNRLLRASGLDLKPDSELKNYDMLVESRLSIGWKPNQPFPKGCRLDDHLEATFGKKHMKTADGADAPKMYQRGELGKLISYCLADVAREKKLFERIWTEGMIRTAANGIHKPRHPAAWFEAPADQL